MPIPFFPFRSLDCSDWFELIDLSPLFFDFSFFFFFFFFFFFSMEALGKVMQSHAAPGEGFGWGMNCQRTKQTTNHSLPQRARANQILFYFIFIFIFLPQSNRSTLRRSDTFIIFNTSKGRKKLPSLVAKSMEKNHKLLPITTRMCLQHKPSRRSSSSSPRTVPRLVRRTSREEDILFL